MRVSSTDEELLSRQSALRSEATCLLDQLALDRLLGDVGPMLIVGSYVSALMCWRDLDVCVLVGPDFTPADVLSLMPRIVGLPGVRELTYRDERCPHCPDGEVRNERYHVPFTLERDEGLWRIDLSLWLHDLHGHVAQWHAALASCITDEQRLAVLRIKDVWHRRPEYPDYVGGWDIYTAVLDDGVTTPEGFQKWLTVRGVATT